MRSPDPAVGVDRSWMARAACLDGHDPSLWHSENYYAQKLAMKVCRACPVRFDCLKFALAVESPKAVHGVWGGLSARQRKKLLTR